MGERRRGLAPLGAVHRRVARRGHRRRCSTWPASAPASDVLDVAAGAGGQTLAAARRVGPRRLGARHRHLAGHPRVRRQRGPRLRPRPGRPRWSPTASSSTCRRDRSTPSISRVGLIYFPDQQAALAGMRRALRPGGRVGAVVYSTPDRNEFFSIPVGIIRRRAQLPPPLPGQPGPFSLGAPGVIEAAFDAGRASPTSTTQRRRRRRCAWPRPPSACASSVSRSARCTRCSPASTRPSRTTPGTRSRTRWRSSRPPTGFVGPCEMLVAVGTEGRRAHDASCGWRRCRRRRCFLDRTPPSSGSASSPPRRPPTAPQLVLFPEAFVPGLPRLGVAHAAVARRRWYARLADQAVDGARRRPPTGSARSPASTASTSSSASTSATPHGGTLYNSLLYFGPDGALLGCHRKLMPTGGERLVWGSGDGSTLTVVRHAVRSASAGSSAGRTTCRWPAPRCTRRASTSCWRRPGTTATSGCRRCATSPRRVGASSSGARPASTAPTCPPTCPGRDELYPGDDDDWMSRGNTTIVGPDGDVLAGPLVGSVGIVAADLDLDRIPRRPPAVRPGRPLRPARRVRAPRRHPASSHGDAHPTVRTRPRRSRRLTPTPSVVGVGGVSGVGYVP